MIHNKPVIPKQTPSSNRIQKHVYHGQVHLRAGPPALSFSYCFGITLQVGRISCSTSYYSPRMKNSALRVISLPEVTLRQRAEWQRAVNRQPGFRSNNS